MSEQPLRDFRSGPGLRFDTYIQGPHPSCQQPGVKRTHDDTLRRPKRLDLRPELPPLQRRQRTCHDVRMPVQILGGRMHDDIGTQFKRLREHRR